MSEKPRKRRKGEQEIRILPDGRVVFVAPDEVMLSLAQEMESERLRDMEAQENQQHDSD